MLYLFKKLKKMLVWGAIRIMARAPLRSKRKVMTEAMFAADTFHSTRPHYIFRHFDSYHAPQNWSFKPQIFGNLISLKVKSVFYLSDIHFYHWSNIDLWCFCGCRHWKCKWDLDAVAHKLSLKRFIWFCTRLPWKSIQLIFH